jgi:SAM-dependent methyltransferase
MSEIYWTIGYGIVVALAVYAALSMEYYARKVKVTASPSVPWMRKAVIDTMMRELSRQNVAAPVIYELGSGFGTLALAAAKAAPQAKIIGYEISPVPLFFSRLRALLGGHRNLRFVSGDFREADLSDADVILTYLTVPLMESLGERLKGRMKTGSVLIANTFPVPGWTPGEEETIQNFVYTLKVFTYRF